MTIKRWIGCMALAFAMVAGAGVQASAQDGLPTAGGGGGGEDVRYEKETSYDFEDDMVEGALVKPDGEMVGGELHGKMSSLIKVRADFIPEMIKSVEDL